MTHLWVRAEQRENEERVGVTPEGVKALLDAGLRVTVEESSVRAIPLQGYIDAGADIAPENSWPQAPADAIVFGLKELPEDGTPLPHRHIMFGHAFKGQHSGKALLQRFKAGGGTLYDLEYLTDPDGRRVAAFGYWAGFAGAAVWAAIRFGVARGVFSNEAGLGSAPIAHAAAECKGPVSQGLIAMLGTFIDTIVICTFTALVILSTGVWTSGETGAELTSLAFETGLPGIGSLITSLALAIFAFTTLVGWSYYSERAWQYLLGVKSIVPFRIIWSLAPIVGATVKLSFIWLLADVLNAMMAIPNLIALAVLSPVVFAATREFFATRGKSEDNPF